MATQHLIELGHRRIGYVGHDDQTDIPCQPDRLEGFLSACMQHGIKVPDAWCVKADKKNADDYLPKLRNLLRQENRPTAIVTFSDGWAVRVIRAAQELGLKVPKDLSVTGFDNSEVGRYNDIPLTTLSPEPDEVGTTIIDLLIEKIENSNPRPKRSILIAPKLIIRNSTDKPNQGKS